MTRGAKSVIAKEGGAPTRPLLAPGNSWGSPLLGPPPGAPPGPSFPLSGPSLLSPLAPAPPRLSPLGPGPRLLSPPASSLFSAFICSARARLSARWMPISVSPASVLHGHTAPLPWCSSLLALLPHPPGVHLAAAVQGYLPISVRAQITALRTCRNDLADPVWTGPDVSVTARQPWPPTAHANCQSGCGGQYADTEHVPALVPPAAGRRRGRLPAHTAFHGALPRPSGTWLARTRSGIRVLE